ncbi:TonB-dependent receptor [Sediminitomix flava]|uniref:TonB-dependent receptor n=1 Tax=Sediminitomix flava TaxID=379075 RepID=UPI001304B4F5|nr:TonB-dependent receptor [Sediminitomix flava]
MSIFTLGFNTNLLYAQVLDSVLYLEEVNIVDVSIPERISFKTTYIEPEIIESNLTASLGEMLSLNTPIFIKSYGVGGTQTPSFRGTGASHTQVYWNGVSLNSPMLGQVDLSLFPVAFSDEVVVNYGASSLMHGTGGLGGAIQMNSRVVMDGVPHVLVSHTANTLQNHISNASVTLGSEKLQSTTKVYYKDAKNLFDFVNPLEPGSPTWTNENSAHLQYGILQEFSFRLRENETFSFYTWYQTSERELPPSMHTEQSFAWQSDESLRFLGSWDRVDEKKSLSLSTYYGKENFYYQKDISNDNFPKISASDTDSYSFQLHGKSSFHLSDKLDLRFGFDYQYDNLNSTVREGGSQTKSNQSDQNIFDLYSGVEWLPSSNLSMSFLVRQELIDDQIQPFLPSLGIDWKAYSNYTQDLNLRVNLSRNFHAPTLNDKYLYPVGNEDMKPEEGWIGEIGGTYHIQKSNALSFKIETTAFASLINNWIVWTPSVSNLWAPKNLKEVFSRGIEQIVSASYDNGRDFSVDLYTSFSYVRSENQEAEDELDKSVGNQLTYTPITSFQGYARMKYKDYYLTIEEQAYGKRFTQTDASEWLPAYYLTNVAVGKKIYLNSHRIDVQARIENIFNYHYQSIARKPMPGRVYQLSLTYRLN